MVLIRLMRQSRPMGAKASRGNGTGRARVRAFAGRTTIGILASLILVPASTAWSAPSSWNVVAAQSVTGQHFILNGVTGRGGDVWAVGYHWETVGGALEFRTLAEHYNGSRFVIVPTPDRETAPAVDILDGIAGVSPSDLWAVGTSSPPGLPDQTLIEHWNGSTWSIVTSPNPGGRGDILQGVAAVSANDVWTVGARQDVSSFFQRPMAEHWNGKVWAVSSVPNAPGCTGHSYLTGVAAASTVDVWATGWCGSGGTTPDQGFVVHWNGQRWSVAAGQGVLPGHSQLYGVAAGGKGNIWVVGSSQAPGASQASALTEHWDGSTWSRVTTSGTSQGAGLRAVVATSIDAWAVGDGSSPQPPFAGPASIHYTKGTGRTVPVFPPFGSLSGVSFDSEGNVWAVGTQLDNTGFNQPLVVKQT
jgi:hypothetical protein